MDTAMAPAETSSVQLFVSAKYAVDRVLGSGATGVVLAARHIQLRERVALKVLRPEVAYLPGLRARFEREAQAAVRIKSEHIVRILDVGAMDSGLPYIVMEFLDGCDLRQLLRTRGAIPIEEAVEYVAQACIGVVEAHAAGVVHRDLKPSNLFLTHRPDGSPLVKVLDFGVSKLASEANDRTELTLLDGVLGSPKYMSPEQARSARSVDARADVWSLGVILYHLLAGRPPFSGESTTELLSAILTTEPALLTDVVPDAPAPLESILRKCLEKNVDRRVQSVAELALALVPWVRSETGALISRIADSSRRGARRSQASAPPPATPDVGLSASGGTAMGWQTHNWLRPKPARIFAAALTFSVVLVAGAIWLARGPDAAPAQTQRPTMPLAEIPPPTVSAKAPLPPALPIPADRVVPGPSPEAVDRVGAQAHHTSVVPARPAPRKSPSTAAGLPSLAKPVGDPPTTTPAPTTSVPHARAKRESGRIDETSAPELRSLIDERQ
jgi:serine/threonine-protein kinase